MGLIGGGSDAKRKVKMFKKLIEKLDKVLNNFNEQYTQVSTGLQEVHSKLTDGPGEAEGKIITDFTEKEGDWNREYSDILTNMQLAKGTLLMRKNEAVMWKSYWENQVRMEEMRGANFNG